MINRYSENERISLLLTCCFSAVREHFSHLSVQQIIDPPASYFDAALARHMVIHLMNVRFDIPRRRLAKVQQRSRTNVLFSIRRVEMRIEDPVFARAYDRIAERTQKLYATELARRAAA